MVVVPFISTFGDVLTVDPEIDPVNDSMVRVRFVLDESEWSRIQDSDIFGAKSRRRFLERRRRCSCNDRLVAFCAGESADDHG